MFSLLFVMLLYNMIGFFNIIVVYIILIFIEIYINLFLFFLLKNIDILFIKVFFFIK